ncbi:MAG: GTPase HflX [Pseudomonadota bacterium]
MTRSSLAIVRSWRSWLIVPREGATPILDDRKKPVFGAHVPPDDAAPSTRGVVVVPHLTSAPRRQGVAADLHSPSERLVETTDLARAIDIEVAAARVVPVPNPRAGTLFGSGKVDELGELISEADAGLVIVDHAVSPIQQRNLETAWNAKVLDRTGLILEIFGRRARTREGSLQVELAHLTYQRGRLVRSWTHLERQRGGFGFLGGPGETQIETDRRLIQERIDKIRGELDVVVRTRALHRAGRKRTPYPIVALVGYTNAGKSTLFNALTDANVYAQDQVFATLDPTMREIVLESGRRLILSDTVGFISNLPTTLVAAFRATLEEVVNADLVLHVRDISHAETEAQRYDVESVLGELGIDVTSDAAPLLEVYNKIDLLSDDARSAVQRTHGARNDDPVLVSALRSEGLDALRHAIDERLGASDVEFDVTVGPTHGRILSWIHDNAEILSRSSDEAGNQSFRLRLSRERRGQLEAKLAALV